MDINSLQSRKLIDASLLLRIRGPMFAYLEIWKERSLSATYGQHIPVYIAMFEAFLVASSNCSFFQPTTVRC